jgi:cupin 2 domain-containing protein
VQVNNIFKNIPTNLADESFEDIISKDGLKIEKIISYGHITEEFQWYDQDHDEWVILLKGEATLSFENENAIELSLGEYINIPAHKKHRVSWTLPNKETIWLAVHY